MEWMTTKDSLILNSIWILENYKWTANATGHYDLMIVLCYFILAIIKNVDLFWFCN